MRNSRNPRARTEKGSATKTLVIVLIVLIVIGAVLFGIKLLNDKNNVKNVSASNQENYEENKIEENKEEPKEEKKPKTFEGDARPIAVMIDNNEDAVPQAGLQEADIVYEMLVEGGETRLMLVLKDKDVSRIGPIRSARPYYIDYALENDAIYVHYGCSTQAQSDLRQLSIEDIDGMYESEPNFWRDSSRYAPHNAVSSTSELLKLAKYYDYETTTKQKPVLNYVADEFELEDGKDAENITIPYSYYNTVKYEYDEESKEYIRYTKGMKQTDWNSDETVKTKNIIITFGQYESINEHDLQRLYNVGTLDGYYITNGKAIQIKCEKESRGSQTVYKDLDGNEINVNDGKTFIQICPKNANVTIE